MNTKVSTIVDMIADLNTKVTLDENLSFVSDDDFDKIYDQVNTLRINIYNHKEVADSPRDRLEALTDMMTMISELKFSQRAYVGNEENHLDYMAIGLNLMSHQLEKRVTPLLAYEKAFNNIKDIAIITDKSGVIKYFNLSASNWLSYSTQEITGKNISSLLRYPELLNYVNKELEFDIEIKNREDELLKVSMSISEMLDDNGLHEGDIYLGRVLGTLSPQKTSKKSVEEITVEQIDFNILLEKIIKDISVYSNFPYFDFKIKVEQRMSFWGRVNHVESVMKNLFVYSLFQRKGIDYIAQMPMPVFELTINDCDNGIMISVCDSGIGINVHGKPAILLDGLCKTTISEDKDFALYLVKESVQIINGNFGAEMRYTIFLPNASASEW